MERIIEVNEVSKIFKRPIRKEGLIGMFKTLFSVKHETKIAVNKVSFNINKGEIVGYIGANGAGKSTTIKMMCGILTPTSGKVLIDQKEPYNSKERNNVLKKIGVVFGQRTQLWWDLPLIETFKILKKIYDVSDEEYEERFDYLKKILEIEKFLSQPARTLSLGQRMRADLAASLLHNPEVLFLDEPTIGLDVLVKEKIIKAIKEINTKYQTTIILTTHDMSDISDLCERIIIIDEGSILYDGSIDSIKNRFGDIRQIYVSSKNKMDLESFNKTFNNQLTLSIVEHYLEVTFDAGKIDVNKVLTYILNNCDIIDIKIKENSIEKVVKKIYETKQF